MRISDIHQRLADLGALPAHRGRVVRAWLQGKPLDAGTRRQHTEHFLPLSVRHGLPQLAEELEGLARVRSSHPAGDGSARLLVDLADGHVRALEWIAGSGPGTRLTVNLGTGVGHSVKELVGAFEAASGRAIACETAPVRPGEVSTVYADAARARDVLGWRARRSLQAMCADAWRWSMHLAGAEEHPPQPDRVQPALTA